MLCSHSMPREGRAHNSEHARESCIVLLVSHDLGLPVLVAMKIISALYKRLVCNVQILEAVKYQRLLERAL